MEKGKINQTIWLKGDVSTWQKLAVGIVIGQERIFTIAWRCPKCGKIELYSELSKQD